MTLGGAKQNPAQGTGLRENPTRDNDVV